MLLSRAGGFLFTPAAGGGEATVTFDNAVISNPVAGPTPGFSYTVGSGSNRALVAAVILVGSLTGTSTGVSATYNGVTMDALGSVTGTGGDIYLFGLVNPASGTNTFAASWSGTAGQMCGGLLSVANADQTGSSTSFPSFVSNSGNSATASTGTITSLSNRICFGGFSSVGSGFTTAGNTDIGFKNSGNVYDAAANYDLNNSNPTLTYSAAAAAWTALGCSIKGH